MHTVATHSSTKDCSHIRNNLRDCDGVLREFELVLQHCRVQVLRAVALEDRIRITRAMHGTIVNLPRN